MNVNVSPPELHSQEFTMECEDTSSSKVACVGVEVFLLQAVLYPIHVPLLFVSVHERQRAAVSTSVCVKERECMFDCECACEFACEFTTRDREKTCREQSGAPPPPTPPCAPGKRSEADQR